MPTDHARFHFSITCKTDDPFVLACLRAICHTCEQAPKAQIAWGGSGEHDWRRAGNRVTFRFTNPHYRDRYIQEAERLLGSHWHVCGTHDNDPATPRRQT